MSLRTSLIVRGVLAIAIGIVSVAWPGITIGAFVILFAFYAFVVAITDAMRAFDSARIGPAAGYLLLSLMSLVAGVVALIWPGPTALVVAVLVGIWAFVIGTFEVAMTFGSGESAGHRAMWLLGGLLSIALGIVLFVRPDIGAESLAVVFGLYSIVFGISALVVSTQAGDLQRDFQKLVSSSV
ncbi:HdeD family acid-resistance protein [Jatrophihabitans sp. DSM 45814]